MTHDYKCHGTTTLFAALNVLTSKLIGTCQRRHRHQEWLRFLTLLDQHTPPTRPLHLIGDNYATHKHLTSAIRGSTCIVFPPAVRGSISLNGDSIDHFSFVLGESQTFSTPFMWRVDWWRNSLVNAVGPVALGDQAVVAAVLI